MPLPLPPGERPSNCERPRSQDRESFAIETTLSGHSELEVIKKAKAAGYSVTMTYVAVEPVEMSALRVVTRSREEGRTVPPNVVLRRYPRSLENFTAVVLELDRVDVYYNSEPQLRGVARLEHGRIIAGGRAHAGMGCARASLGACHCA